MTGVEILTTIKVANEFGFNWGAFWASFLIFFVGFILLFVFIVFEAPDEIACWIASAFFAILFGGVFGFIIGSGNATPVGYETQYKVTISDEVSMNEFNEKYEIVEQDGKIYTVRERE